MEGKHVGTRINCAIQPVGTATTFEVQFACFSRLFFIVILKEIIKTPIKPLKSVPPLSSAV